jgi:hypothetical protein
VALFVVGFLAFFFAVFFFAGFPVAGFFFGICELAVVELSANRPMIESYQQAESWQRESWQLLFSAAEPDYDSRVLNGETMPMDESAEFPETTIVEVADQFCAAAEMLLRAKSVGPSAVLVNAALATELYIKSLNSRWVSHPEPDFDESYIVTTQSNTKGHDLTKLFEELPDDVQAEITTAFPGIDSLLSIYSLAFESERYGFELLSRPYDSRPIIDMVNLAKAFRTYVKSKNPIRFEISSDAKTERQKKDAAIAAQRVRNDLKVLSHTLSNVRELATGKLESPEKLMVYYAGYTAMRSIWDAKTRGGKLSTGNADLDKELKNKEGRFIFRVNQEISHSIGDETKTLLRVVTFKYWAKLVLKQWGDELEEMVLPAENENGPAPGTVPAGAASESVA